MRVVAFCAAAPEASLTAAIPAQTTANTPMHHIALDQTFIYVSFAPLRAAFILPLLRFKPAKFKLTHSLFPPSPFK